MARALDTAEQAVFVVGGVAVLFVGYKLYRGITGARGDLLGGDLLPGAPAGVIPGSSADYSKGPGRPQCHTDVGWFSQTEQCDAVPEPADIKARGRTERLLWGMANGNEHTVLQALQMPGEDIETEPKAIYWAAQRWRDQPRDEGAPIGAKNYDGDFYKRNEDAGKILLWWGSRSKDTQIKTAADANDIATLKKYATGEF